MQRWMNGSERLRERRAAEIDETVPGRGRARRAVERGRESSVRLCTLTLSTLYIQPLLGATISRSSHCTLPWPGEVYAVSRDDSCVMSHV